MEKNNLTNLTEEQLEAIKKVSEELVSYLSKNDNTTPVLLPEKKFEGEINEFDINPAQIFNDEYDMAKTYTDDNLELLEMVANYIQLYQLRNNICSFPLEKIGDDKYFQKQNFYAKIYEERRTIKLFPFVKYYFTDFGMHSYFYGYDHILKRENNETLFDLLFCLKLNQIEFHEIDNFLKYHQSKINNYFQNLDLLADEFELLFKDNVLKRVRKYIKNNQSAIETPTRVNTKKISIDDRIIETLFSSLQVYFDEKDYDDLKKVLSGKDIGRKLLFNSMSAAFVHFFKILKEKGYISDNKKQIGNWIYTYFKYINKNMASDFNLSTIKNTFKPTAAKPQLIILNQDILRGLEKIINPHSNNK